MSSSTKTINPAMDLLNLDGDIFETQTPFIGSNHDTSEKGSSNGVEPTHMLSPHVRFKLNDDPYQMTTSISGRIAVFSEGPNPKNEINLATIDGLPSDRELADLCLDDLVCTIYGQYGFCTLDQLAGDAVSLTRAYELILRTLSEYTEAPVTLSGYANWDEVMETARKNALNILSKVAVPA